MDVKRVAKFVKTTGADAWVVAVGSAAVLRWFAADATPCFAWDGRMQGIEIAGCGTDKSPAYREATRRLLELGHRRIVVLHHAAQSVTADGGAASAVLEEMAACGIATGPYNCPVWTHTPAGLKQCLDSLFAHTPPTALFISSPALFHAVRVELAYRRIVVPRDISLICADMCPSFRWVESSVACFRWKTEFYATQVIRWVERLAHGRNDQRQKFVKARYVDGGTVGPAPKR
jgi:DNA-binding LacI/PurR family transcriptional regulator